MSPDSFAGGQESGGLDLQNPDVAGAFAHEAMHTVQGGWGYMVAVPGGALIERDYLTGSNRYQYPSPSSNATQNLQDFIDGTTEQQGAIIGDIASGHIRAISVK